jgi:hypothetical protein
MVFVDRRAILSIIPNSSLGAWRIGVNLLVLVVLLCFSSFAIYIYGSTHDVVGAFFSPQARAWELMAGAILAHLTFHGSVVKLPRRRHGYISSMNRETHRSFSPAADFKEGQQPRLSSMVSLLGLLFIVFAVFSLNQGNYPGPGALLPVLGAVLLIVAGPAAWVNRFILSNRHVVLVGQISYPLYLYHWPLLSYLRIIDGKPPELFQRVVAVIIAVVLAYLTFIFIEKPIRSSVKHKNVVVGSLIAGMATLLVLGSAAKFVVPRYDEQAQKILEILDFSGCPEPQGERLDERYKFTTLGHNDQNKILFFGNSHALQYRNTFAELLKGQPSMDARLPEVMFNTGYTGFSDLTKISKEILADNTISTVVFSTFWALDHGSDKINYPIRCCGKGLMGTVGERPPPLTPEQLTGISQELESLESAVSALTKSGKKVYFVLDNPFGEELVPRDLLKRSLFGGIEIRVTPLSKSKAIESGEPVRTRIINIARRSGAGVIDPIDGLCVSNVCPALSADGTPIYRDYDHLSLYAVTHLVKYFDFLVVPPAIQ